VPHILIGLGIAFVAFPLSRTQATRNRINHWWSRWVLRLCGVRLRVSGQPLSDELVNTGMTPGGNGRLLLSNHISWLDIFSINAAMPCRFVAKAEIVSWPIIGGMVGTPATLFIERGKRRAVATVNEAVQGTCEPERASAYFLRARRHGATACCRSIRTCWHRRSRSVAPSGRSACAIPSAANSARPPRFVGDMGFVTSLANVLVADDLEIEVAFLPPLDASAYQNRPHAGSRGARSAVGVLRAGRSSGAGRSAG